MKLFHSIFGGGETRGRYPETLLREAIERAVDGTDTRLRLNIQRDEGDPSARRVALQELHNASGQRAVMLPISLAPRELPPREDFVTAAERYL